MGAAFDDAYSVARAADDAFRAWTSAVAREHPGMRRAVFASSVVYVGAAWVFVLPSAVALAAEALAAALRVATAVITLACSCVFCAYAVTRGDTRRARRVAARLRVVKRVALGFFDVEGDEEPPRTPPRTPPNDRFIERLDDADAQERIERLTAEKRAAERANEEGKAMLSEASKTIEALRDALEATDAARVRRRRAD